MPGAARAQPAGYKAGLRGPPGAVWTTRPSLALLRAQGCAADETEEGTLGSEASVTRSHATSRQRRVWPNSQRPRPGEAGGGATGQSTPPQEHLFRGPFTSYGSSRKEDPPRVRPPRRTQGTPGALRTGAWRPLLDRNVSSRDSEGTPCSSRPHHWGFQTSPGSRQVRQPRVRAKTVPSKTVPGGKGQLPRSQGTFLRGACGERGGGRGVLRMPRGRDMGRSGDGQPGPFNALSYAPVTLGAAGSRRAESRAEQSGEGPPPHSVSHSRPGS